MNIQSEKKSLIEWLSSVEDEETIEQIKCLKENSVNGVDWWSQISEEEKEGIEKGLKDLDEGREASFEGVKDKYRKWLTK